MKFSTLVDLLCYQSLDQPSEKIYTFLQDGETEAGNLSYQELELQARAIAAYLQSINATGERVLLLYPPGLEFIAGFFGCLYAKAIAIPAYLPQPNQSLSKLQAIAIDAQATLALTTTSLLVYLKGRFAENPELAKMHLLATNNIPSNQGADWQKPTLSSDTLAFLQYTSGSTGTPKGVMITHENVMHNLAMSHRSCEITPDARTVTWLPFGHNAGLVSGILQPLYSNFPVTIMSPLDFLQKPLRWLMAISHYKATQSLAPNFAYDLACLQTTPQQRAMLDLSNWELAISAAEPVRAETIERFITTFEPYGFRPEAFNPAYGIAENVLLITVGLKTKPLTINKIDKSALEQNRIVVADNESGSTQKIVSCGRTWLDQKIAIVNPESLTQCPADQVGEIWVSSPSVAQGYWNQPEATKETFLAYLADTGVSEALATLGASGPFLRTGDLGFLLNGELFITGRLKDLIIVRGRNHYPQDIEQTVGKSNPALVLNCGAAFSVEIESEERLVIVQEVEKTYLEKLNVDEVVTAIRQAVSQQHELQVYAVLLLNTGSIPKTSNGKIQRHACRSGFLDDSLEQVGKWSIISDKAMPLQHLNTEVKSRLPELQTNQQLETDLSNSNSDLTQSVIIQQKIYSQEAIQAWLISKVSEQLQILPEEIDICKPLSNYGLSSMTAVNLSGQIQEWVGCPLSSTLLSDYPTIETLAQQLVAKVRSSENPLSFSLNIKELGGQNNSANLDEILPENYRFNLWTEYLDLQKRLEQFQNIGNPFFQIHEGVARDTTRIDGRELINYASYNYLGMSGHPVVSEAAKVAIDHYGTSVSASRLASGEKPLHRELEREIADFLGTEDCITYIGGHTTNETTIGHLFSKDDLILHDSLSHNSILQGCSLSTATVLAFAHNDWQILESILRQLRHRYRRVLIVTEGIYSADGDIAPLPELIEVKKRYKAFLMVDEAHSIGVLGKYGRGIGEYFGVNPTDIDLYMGTLSKSFASCGGYIAGCKELIEYLKYTAPGFVFSVGMSPPNAAAALAAIQVLKAEPGRVAILHERAKLFLNLAQEQGLNTGTSKDAPIVPIIIGDSLISIKLSQALMARGINVQPMIYPSVPHNAARLRFFITCAHTEEQICLTVNTLVEELTKLQGTSKE